MSEQVDVLADRMLDGLDAAPGTSMRALLKAALDLDGLAIVSRQDAEDIAAIRRLPPSFALQRTANGRCRLYLYDGDPEVPIDGWHTAQAADSIAAAITEALSDDC